MFQMSKSPQIPHLTPAWHLSFPGLSPSSVKQILIRSSLQLPGLTSQNWRPVNSGTSQRLEIVSTGHPYKPYQTFPAVHSG